jgi:hypothetical protein
MTLATEALIVSVVDDWSAWRFQQVAWRHAVRMTRWTPAPAPLQPSLVLWLTVLQYVFVLVIRPCETKGAQRSNAKLDEAFSLL